MRINNVPTQHTQLTLWVMIPPELMYIISKYFQHPIHQHNTILGVFTHLSLQLGCIRYIVPKTTLQTKKFINFINGTTTHHNISIHNRCGKVINEVNLLNKNLMVYYSHTRINGVWYQPRFILWTPIYLLINIRWLKTLDPQRIACFHPASVNGPPSHMKLMTPASDVMLGLLRPLITLAANNHPLAITRALNESTRAIPSIPSVWRTKYHPVDNSVNFREPMLGGLLTDLLRLILYSVLST